MKRTILTVLFAFACFFPAGAETGEEKWQAKAVEKYPELSVQGSEFNNRFLEAYAERLRTDPGFFTIEKWPLLLADHVANQLAQPDQKPEAAPPPADGPVEGARNDTPPPVPWVTRIPSLSEFPGLIDGIRVGLVILGSAGTGLVLVAAFGASALLRRNKAQLKRDLGRASPPTAAADEAVVARVSPDETLWIGHASYWHYFWRWIFGALLFVVGIGALIITGILVDRARRVYIVTSRKVIFQFGLLAKSTNEIRIKDIRSINVAKNGIGGLLGIGSVEFSSAASDRAEITFSSVANADQVRDVVSRIQDQG